MCFFLPCPVVFSLLSLEMIFGFSGDIRKRDAWENNATGKIASLIFRFFSTSMFDVANVEVEKHVLLCPKGKRGDCVTVIRENCEKKKKIHSLAIFTLAQASLRSLALLRA